MVYENKYEKPYEARNMNNYAILSNNDAIKDDEGRRYFILDISGHRQIIKGSKTEAENQKFWIMSIRASAMKLDMPFIATSWKKSILKDSSHKIFR